MATTPALDRYRKEETEALGAEIVEKLKGQFFPIEGTPKLPVKYAAGNYDTKPLIAGHEFTLVNVFVGARGYAVFQFSPEDTQEWELVDFTAKQLDDFMPLFGPAIAGAYEITGIDAAPALIKHLVSARMDTVAREAEAAEANAKKTFANNPMFGRFG